MRYILILILLINTAYGQGATTFGAARAQDTSKTAGQVRFSAYTGADTTVPVFMPNGTIKQVSKGYFSSGGSFIPYSDTATKVATKWDVDSVENALKYIQLNNITTSAPLIDYVIRDGDTSSWAQEYRETGNCVWWSKINKWVYVYAGFIPPYAGNNIYLGIMTSPDMRTWTDLGKISNRSMEDPYILVSNDSLHIYAEDKEDVPFRNIRMLATADAATWYDKGDVLDIGTGSDWDSRDVSSPVVKKIGDTTYMWFEGRATGQLGAIGIATSTNRYNWTKYAGNPVITGTNLSDSTFNWATHVVSHDIDIVNDEIYLFVTPYVGALAEFTSSIALGSTRNIYQYRDYLGTWLPRRRDIGGGGMKTWVNNRYVLFGVDTSATKITTLKFTSIVNGDFVNKPIATDDSIRGRYLNVKNANGFTSVITSAATSNRTDTIPDKSGTFAMTSDIPSTPSLQQVTTVGATTTDGITTGNLTTDTVYGGTASGGNIVVTSTANATKGKVIFGTSAYDEVNNRLGIGTTTPGARFEIVGQGRAISNGSAAQWIALSTGGTSGSPTATPANQEIASFGGAGTSDGTTYTGRRAAYSIKATETWTSTANGSALDFKTTANGSTGSTDRGRIDQNGDWLVATTTNNGSGRRLQVTGRVGATDTIYTSTRMQEAGIPSAIIGTDANGVHYAASLSASATLDFPNTSNGDESDLTITVTGAADGDVVALGTPNGSSADGSFHAYVSAANTVTVRFVNHKGTSIDPPSGTFKVIVFK